jgi:flagellar basal-body rod modification protein FlgD
MDSKEFAVQLAQFTQVEKLISIDEQMTKQSQNAGSMAGYLGQQVILNSSDAAVKGGNGGQVQLNLAQDAQNIRVQFVDGSGKVVGEKVVDQLSKGKQLVTLDGLTIPDGTYSVQVKASSRFGAGDFRVPVAAAGLVSGFIPGPDPKLIVNGREIGVGEIQEVTLPSPA